MPLYEFECEGCGKLIEQIQKFKDPAPACPSCNLPTKKKVGGRSVFDFKGTGWYTTDYKRKS
jgi:putative FmdB family regulatory protein